MRKFLLLYYLCDVIKVGGNIFMVLLFAGLWSGCGSDRGWDMALNGRWSESAPANTRSLPSNCDITFSDHMMSLCGSSITSGLNPKSDIFAQNGQIWIEYRLATKRHVEFRYDYAFDGKNLWITEDTSEKNQGAINRSGAKMYIKK